MEKSKDEIHTKGKRYLRKLEDLTFILDAHVNEAKSQYLVERRIL